MWGSVLAEYVAFVVYASRALFKSNQKSIMF